MLTPFSPTSAPLWVTICKHIWMTINLQRPRKEDCVRKITLPVLRHLFMGIQKQQQKYQFIKKSFESTWRRLRSQDTEKVTEFKVITLIELGSYFFQASELQKLEYTFNLGLLNKWLKNLFFLTKNTDRLSDIQMLNN